MVKSKWRSALVIALAIITSDAALATGNDDSLDVFLTTYECSLAGLIAKILAHPGKEQDDRFVILALPRPLASYVQCLFSPDGRDALCEASSGWWNNSWEKPHFDSAELRALAHLGFSTNGSHGNFLQKIHFPPGGPDPDAVARLMLSALYEGYGAHKGMRIEVEAPYALRHGFLPKQRCALIS